MGAGRLPEFERNFSKKISKHIMGDRPQACKSNHHAATHAQLDPQIKALTMDPHGKPRTSKRFSSRKQDMSPIKPPDLGSTKQDRAQDLKCLLLMSCFIFVFVALAMVCRLPISSGVSHRTTACACPHGMERSGSNADGLQICIHTLYNL